MDLDKYWSLRGYAPRPEQAKIINQIKYALDNGYTNIIVEAGTGIGKTPIATTIAKTFHSSYILTMTNQLQGQYLQDFSYMLEEIKGRGNYYCNYGGCCDECEAEKQDVRKCPDCEYLLALHRALNSKTVITNYDYLFYAGNYAQQLDTRDLLILDETHNFENKMMSLISDGLSRTAILRNYGFDIFDTIVKGGTLKSINSKKHWIRICEKLIEFEKAQYPATKHDAKKQENAIPRYERIIDNLNEDGWIVELPRKSEILENKKGLRVEFKPLSIAKYSDMILDFGYHKLFLTGTLGDKDKFCEWVGINPADTFYIYAKSPFPVENRPIIKHYFGSMSKGNWQNTEVIQYIQDIINTHNGEKGVIHTSSNQQAWWIKKHLNSKLVWIAQGDTREVTIEKFEKSNKPIVLIGAGIKDGVDFKGDKCRFQIIFKIPYPNLGSTQINIRKRQDPSWYAYQTIMPLMQSYGRGIRDMDDYCTTYVLDKDFDRLLEQYPTFFNDYFTEAIL